MNKKVFLEHWIDWTIAIIIMVFIIVWGAIQRFSIEQEYGFAGDDIYYSIKIHQKSQKQNQGEVSGNAILFRVANDGGLCSYGACFSETVIKGSGDWVTTQGGGEATNGKVDAQDAIRVYEIANSTNFAAMREHAFTGVCPSAYDGPHYTYTFLTAHGEEKLDSCITKIDQNSTLFKEVNSLLEKL